MIAQLSNYQLDDAADEAFSTENCGTESSIHGFVPVITRKGVFLPFVKSFTLMYMKTAIRNKTSKNP